MGAINLLDACQSESADIEKIIFTSSANVYGEPSVELLHEDICPAPVNAYGCSKLAMEHLDENYRKFFPLQIVRPFNFTGRGQTERFLIPKIVSHFQSKHDSIELGNTHVSRDFSDVRDVAREFVELLGDASSVQTVNICSGNFLQLKEILSFCQDITDHEIKVITNPNFVRANEIVRLYGSRDRLDSLIGKRPVRDFKNTLRWMLKAE